MYNNLKSQIPFDVAIVGAGASGTLLAAQFKRLAPHSRLAIFGNTVRPARGVAYETQFNTHLLNVRASNMSAFPDDMDHFVKWLKPRLPKSNADTYAPRRFYGDYLAGILYETLSDLKNTEYIVGTVINLSHDDGIWTIHLDHGSSVEAHQVVLALGNLLFPSDPIDFSAVNSNYRRNPWTLDAVLGLDENAPILLVGTGLTMVDAVLSLREIGHRGSIHSISRHGRLYQSHKLHKARPLLSLPRTFESPVGALRWIRREIKAAHASGFDWRSVIDSLRPYATKIWQSWSFAQRGSFLRHARNLWDTHRHRIPPEISDQLGLLVEDRLLVVHRGRLVSAKPHGQNATVNWKDPDGEIHSLNVARIINCTGPARDYARCDLPLVDSLRSSGWLTADPLGLGVETDADGRLRGVNGEPVTGLYALGPLRLPALWESIAIPEIRNQAVALAKLLVSESVQIQIVTT